MADEEKKAEESKETPAAETKQEDSKEEKISDDKKEFEVPKKFKDLVKQVEEMSVLELAELVKILEDKFGVSAAAPVAVVAAAPGAAGEVGAAEEKTEFDVELTSVGDSKINVIKAVKEVTGKGLADAKALVDGVPNVIKEKIKKEEAEEVKKKIEDAGGAVSLK